MVCSSYCVRLTRANVEATFKWSATNLTYTPYGFILSRGTVAIVTCSLSNILFIKSGSDTTHLPIYKLKQIKRTSSTLCYYLIFLSDRLPMKLNTKYSKYLHCKTKYIYSVVFFFCKACAFQTVDSLLNTKSGN